MGKYTKWIFAGLGWVLSAGSPLGAVLGYAVGNAISKNSTGNSGNGAYDPGNAGHRGPYRNTGSQQDINIALMVLIASVMKADGNVRKSELDYVKRFLLQNYGEEHGKEYLHLLQDLVQKDLPINDICQQIKVNTDYTTRYHMVDFLFGIGGADGQFDTAEINMLRLIAQYLGIAHPDYTSIFERHVGYADASYSAGSGYSGKSTSSDHYNKDPYCVLGIDSSATDDEVRKAYRRMAMKYHPDKVSGMSEEMQRNAAEQMKEINAAYETIKQRRDSLK